MMKIGSTLLLLLFLSSCTPMTTQEYRHKMMLKQDKKMFKQVQKSRKCPKQKKKR
jgi:hypothetical protein